MKVNSPVAHLSLVLGDGTQFASTLNKIASMIAEDPDTENEQGIEIHMVITKTMLEDFISQRRDALCDWYAFEVKE